MPLPDQEVFFGHTTGAFGYRLAIRLVAAGNAGSNSNTTPLAHLQCGTKQLVANSSQPNKIFIINSLCYNCGGEGGIRTLVRVTPKHAFQACALSRSATSPQRGPDEISRPFTHCSHLLPTAAVHRIAVVAIRYASANTRRCTASTSDSTHAPAYA